ncbi:MAG: hypothetical protein IKV97_02350 [Clostridia bacterium]|nr:hypothetical protein [Clostridia bacterium]
MPDIPHLSGSTEYRKFGTEEKDREDDIFGNSDSQLLKWQDINMQNLQSISDGRITKSAEFSGTGYKEFGTEEKDRRKRTFTDEKTPSLKGEDFDKKYRSFLENDKLPKNTEFKSVHEDKKTGTEETTPEPGVFWEHFNSANGESSQGLFDTGVLNQRLFYGKDPDARYIINNYKSSGHTLPEKTLNTLNSITAQDMQNGYNTALQTLKNNMMLGNLSKEDLEQRPHMMQSLALYYVASEKGLHNIANSAWKLAYTDIPAKQLPVAERIGEEKSGGSEHPILDGVSNTLAVLSLIPGIDSATNFALIFVDAARGDWGSVFLDVVGVLPYVGELSDAARLAKTGSNIADAAKLMKVGKAAKAADKVMDAADAARTLDKAADIAKTADAASKSDFLKNLYKKSVTDATHAAGISKLMGKSGNAEFIRSFGTKLITEASGTVGGVAGKTIAKQIGGEAAKKIGTKVGTSVGEVFGNVVGSAIVTASDELVNGEKNMQEIAKESAKAAAFGLFSELSSKYIGHAIKMADEAGSAARELMKNYTATDGEFLKAFFDELLMALGQGMAGG